MAADIRAVLFDKDGTLIDFRATWLPAYEAGVRDQFGDDEALVHRLLVAGGYDRVTGTLDPHSVLAAGTNDEIAGVFAALTGRRDIGAVSAGLNQSFMRHARQSLVPVTDLPALFGRLRRRGLKLGVATNDSAAALTAQLAQLQVAALVDFAVGFDSGHGAKPGPGMVGAFAGHVGVPAASIAVVGDSRHDLDMGRSAGAGLLVGVLTGASPREHLEPHADRVLASIADLEAVLFS